MDAPYYDYVLIGNFAAVNAAQAIREHDKQGSILLIGEEKHPPYDRPPLSKNMLVDDDYTPEDAYSKYDDFYPKNQITLHMATRVTRIDRQARTVTLPDGDALKYGKLLLATGSRPRPLEAPGGQRTGVFLLRHIEESLAIRQAMQQSKRVVIVGAGYIGMEVGGDAHVRGLDVTIVEPNGYPWSRFASEPFGRFLQRYYEGKGVKFVFNDEVVALEGEGEHGPVKTVVTKNGLRLPADFVVVGIGVDLNTELAKEAGLEVDPKNGVRVNEYLQTFDPDVYVAGDIAFFKDVVLEKEWHAEHHLNAKWQGQTAGANMAGANQPYDKVAYFFSDELDIHMVLRGDPQGGKNTFFVGDVDGAEFIELYSNDAGRLMMGIAVSHEEPKLDAISDTLEKLIRARVNIKGREAEIRAPGFDLNSLV